MYAVPKIELDATLLEIKALAMKIREKKAIMRDESRIIKQCTKPKLPRTSAAKTRGRSVSRLRNEMENLGVDMNETDDAHFTRATKGKAKTLGPISKRMRMDVDSEESNKINRNRSLSFNRTAPRNEMGVKDVAVSVFCFFFNVF